MGGRRFFCCSVRIERDVVVGPSSSNQDEEGSHDRTTPTTPTTPTPIPSKKKKKKKRSGWNKRSRTQGNGTTKKIVRIAVDDDHDDVGDGMDGRRRGTAPSASASMPLLKKQRSSSAASSSAGSSMSSQFYFDAREDWHQSSEGFSIPRGIGNVDDDDDDDEHDLDGFFDAMGDGSSSRGFDDSNRSGTSRRSMTSLAQTSNERALAAATAVVVPVVRHGDDHAHDDDDDELLLAPHLRKSVRQAPAAEEAAVTTEAASARGGKHRGGGHAAEVSGKTTTATAAAAPAVAVDSSISVGDWGYPGWLTRDQLASYRKFKNELNRRGGAYREMVDWYRDVEMEPYALCRYLRSCHFHIPRVFRYMDRHVEKWNNAKRHDFYPNLRDAVGAPTSIFLTQFPSVYCGLSKRGCPVAYFHASNLSTEGLQCVTTLERVPNYFWYMMCHEIKRLYRRAREYHPEMQRLQQMTVMNLEGLSSSLFTAQTYALIQRMDDITSAFPDMLMKIVVINAPGFFSLIWGVIKGFLNENTTKLVEIYSDRERGTKRLLELIDEHELPRDYGGMARPVSDMVLREGRQKQKQKHKNCHPDQSVMMNGGGGGSGGSGNDDGIVDINNNNDHNGDNHDHDDIDDIPLRQLVELLSIRRKGGSPAEIKFELKEGERASLCVYTQASKKYATDFTIVQEGEKNNHNHDHRWGKGKGTQSAMMMTTTVEHPSGKNDSRGDDKKDAVNFSAKLCDAEGPGLFRLTAKPARPFPSSSPVHYLVVGEVFSTVGLRK